MWNAQQLFFWNFWKPGTSKFYWATRYGEIILILQAKCLGEKEIMFDKAQNVWNWDSVVTIAMLSQ